MNCMDMMDTGVLGQAGNPARWGQLYVGLKHSLNLAPVMQQESMMLYSTVVKYLFHALSFRGPFKNPHSCACIYLSTEIIKSDDQ